MAKRPETLETVVLALQLLRRIPRERKITASQLHAQLKEAGIERDLRTIQRQLEMLCEHFEIERDSRSKPYGYRWRDEAKALAVPTLTLPESLLLRLAQEHLKNLLPAHLMKSMEGFFTQAQRNLEVQNTAHLEKQWLEKIRVVATSQPLLPPKIAKGVFEVVSQALYANNWLQLDYKNSSGKRSQVQIMPLGLVQQGPRLYLVGRYRGYDNERNLAMHRILSAQMLEQSFERPRAFDLKKYDDDGRFGFGEGEKVRLTFRIEREAGLHLLETPLSEDQRVLELEGGLLEITATVVDSAMLQWWLRGFGEAISHVHRTTPTSA